MPPTAEPLLAVTGATKRFRVGRGLSRHTLTALDDVDLTVGPGETLGLVGESGSGKSTLGKAILRLLDLDGGTIVLDGQPVHALDRRRFRPFRRRIQMVFQNPGTSFNPRFTIEDTLVEAMLLSDADASEKRRRARALLDTVELGSRFLGLYPHEMSGGQLQRVAIARALAPSPGLIFLDEPTAALDMSIRGQVVNMLRALQKERATGFIFVSHDLRVIRYVADRVVVMYLGQVVESGSRDALFTSPLHPYTQALFSAVTDDSGRTGTERVSLKGEIGASAPTVGCRLAPRCPFALERCFAEPQALRELAPGHRARCWRADPSEPNALPQRGPVA